jgi:hypothetical protein
MTQLQTQIKTDTWITTTWDEYLQILEQPVAGVNELQSRKFYLVLK